MTVYTTGPDCQACRATIRMMDRLGIEHEVVEFADAPDVEEWAVKEMGYVSAPVVVVEAGETKLSWQGYNRVNIRGLLGGVREPV